MANRYPGTCFYCRGRVEQWEGVIFRDRNDGGKWKVHHPGCDLPATPVPPTPQPEPQPANAILTSLIQPPTTPTGIAELVRWAQTVREATSALIIALELQGEPAPF